MKLEKQSMSKNNSKVYYDPKVQCLWKEEWMRMIPIEEVGVSRLNDYENKEARM